MASVVTFCYIYKLGKSSLVLHYHTGKSGLMMNLGVDKIAKGGMLFMVFGSSQIMGKP